MFINKKFALMSMTKPAYRIAKEEDIGAIMKMQFKLFKRWDSMDKIDKIGNSWFFRSCGLKPSHDSGVDVCPPCAQSASNKIA